ncbi:hypothetical protein ES332_A02G102300v1 [Gossypium tomentosum]|uniref:Uncharacterized protein n=1 Tax=Gossypium tomentosum TaxID=34277 RepID=A0A5D2RF98_GOSTO|nr:hypothetical protein ES332_A02G102300v1 [Gossypium tomentosum]
MGISYSSSPSSLSLMTELDVITLIFKEKTSIRECKFSVTESKKYGNIVPRLNRGLYKGNGSKTHFSRHVEH